MSHIVVGIIAKLDPIPSYLLVSSRNDFGEYSGYYYPPGGHVEDGEEEIEALEREILEELGITATVSEKLADSAGDVQDQKTSWYLCEISDYNLIIDYTELQDAGFFTKEEMKSMKIWPATKKIFEKYIF